MSAALLLSPVQMSPHLCRISDQHFIVVHGEGGSILMDCCTSSLPSFLFSERLSEECGSLLSFFRPQEQSLTVLAPWIIPSSYLSPAAVCCPFSQGVLPTVHLFFNLCVCLCVCVSHTHTLQLERGRKTFQLLSKSNRKPLS